MSAAAQTLYTLIPLQDTLNSENFHKVEKVAKGMGILLMVSSGTAMIFYLIRLLKCYDEIPSTNSVYYGIIASLTSFVAIQAMSMAFSVLFIVGSIKHQQSFLFLWLVSVFVLLALDTVVTVYSSALKDHANELWTGWGKAEIAVYMLKVFINIPAVIIAIIVYRAIEDEQRNSVQEREILL